MRAICNSGPLSPASTNEQLIGEKRNCADCQIIISRCLSVFFSISKRFFYVVRAFLTDIVCRILNKKYVVTQALSHLLVANSFRLWTFQCEVGFILPANICMHTRFHKCSSQVSNPRSLLLELQATIN